MFKFICLGIGYLIGCFQTAYFIGKTFFKIDIREHGSKNSGSTNAARVLGKKAGLIVFFCDIFKAILAYVICSAIFNGNGVFYNAFGEFGNLPGLYAGVGVILGHNFPVFLKFKGGKGSASGIGLILAFDFRITLLCAVGGIAVVYFTKYVSLASMVITLFLVIGTFIFNFSSEVKMITIFLLLLSVFQHRENIKRLLKGEENKFKFKSLK